MNTYYIVNANQIEQARQYAPETGLPNQLFQCTVNPNGASAIVQADWIDTVWLNTNGTYLGELQPDGSASQEVYDELAKPEWQYTME